MSAPAYRPEIDGLRAVAVLPVILFHAGFSVFSGGYVGVDVFFVISGYLITSILLRELEEDRFSIARFYERRARRILPALLFVIVATTPFAWAWLSAPQYADYAASIVAVLLFVSNFLFWQQADYFDTAAEEKPLLHTWSLAIEEQYYIIFPILLLILWRKMGPRAALTSIAVLALASLAFSEMIARDRTVANFYLLPSRAWELLAGSLCAFAHHHKPRQPNSGLAALGLGMIVLSIVLFDEHTPFPSLLTLLPVGGSALILLFADTKGLAGKLLSWSPMVGIGLISYSAYLWHQPLFALARVRFDVPDAGIAIALLGLASLGLAWLSWKFVEQPFRKGMPLKPFVVRTSAVAGLLAVIGTVGTVEAMYGRSRLATVVYNDALINSEEQREESWAAVLQNPDFEQRLSTFSDPGEHRILLVGDSHAKDVFNALWFGAGADDPESAIQVRHTNLGGRCTDRIGQWLDGTSSAQCFRQFERQAGELLADADVVILTKRWVLEETWRDYLPVYVERLQAMGKTVAIAGNTVEYDPEVPELLRRLWRRGELNDSNAARALAEARAQDVVVTNTGLREIADELGIPFLDKTGLLCADDGCPGLTEGGAAIYSDYGHWSLAGAEEIGEHMIETAWLSPLLRNGTGQ